MTAASRRRDDSRPSTSRRSSDPSFSTRSVTARDRSPQGLIAVARRGLQAMIEDLKPGAGAAARLGPFVKGPRTRLSAPASPPSLPVRYPAARSRLPLPRPRKQRCWSASSWGSIACGCSEVSGRQRFTGSHGVRPNPGIAVIEGGCPWMFHPRQTSRTSACVGSQRLGIAPEAGELPAPRLRARNCVTSLRPGSLDRGPAGMAVVFAGESRYAGGVWRVGRWPWAG